MGKDQELIEAARNGDIAVVEKILNQRAKRSGPWASLRRGPGANAQDSQGYSALHHAAVNRHRDIVALLLSHEASTNIVDLKGSSPLHLAAWSGSEEIVRLLLTSTHSVPNVNMTNQASETALHLASQYGNMEVVKLLLEHGADPTIPNLKQETALDLAAQYGRLETVELLLKAHPELISAYTTSTSTRNLFLHTPLHSASRNGHRKTVETLLKAGFNANTRTSQGTALHEAALCGKVDVVKALLDAGIDVCVTDSQRRTAVDRLQEVGLKTPVAKEIAEHIRGALKKSHMMGTASSPCSPHERVPITQDGKLLLSNILDNQSHNDNESVASMRHSYSPRQSPKANSFTRGKTRRSMDANMSKGPDYDKPAPPKKPPRRNLSASPTHPGAPDFAGDNYDLVTFGHMGRNKSMDESAYGDRWRKSVATCYETSQSNDSLLDMSPLDHQKSSSCAKSDIAFFNGLVIEELKSKSKSQHQGLDNSNFVSVAHIKLRDAKSEQNVSQQGLKPTTVIDLETSSTNYNNNNNNSSSVAQAAASHVNNNAKSKCESTAVTTTNSKTIITAQEGPGIVNDDHSGVDKNATLSKKPQPKGPKPAIAPKPKIAPKPRNIKRQGHSCDNVLADGGKQGRSTQQNQQQQPPHDHPKKTTPKSTSMSVLSPVDVDKEWESITKFMDSLSVKIGGDGQPVVVRGEGGGVGGSGKGGDGGRHAHVNEAAVRTWLAGLGMEQYEKLFLANGFDDTEFLGEEILDESSLLEIGILNAQHRKIVVDAASKLDVSWPRAIEANGIPVCVEKWLQELHVDQYTDTFRKNLYVDPERLLKLWNDELTTVLDINLLGHRRRILAASKRAAGLRRTTNSPRLENGTEIDETQSDGSLPLRDPKDLVSGVSSALKTAWRHTPETLINGSITYKAIYVGYSLVQEFSTTDLIQGAIQRIRTGAGPNPSAAMTTGTMTPNGQNHKLSATVLNINVTLIVSATVVSWYNSKTKSLVREHEIGSIQCTCQASDDLRHLALVTKAADPSERSHSCHVFCLDSVEVATEAILTLGQAFEVAYQLAVSNRSQSRDYKGHMRSKSANQLSTKSTCPPSVCVSKLKQETTSKSQTHIAASNHIRSQSVNDIPPPVLPVAARSTSNSPQTHHHHHNRNSKDNRFPRAESFSYSCSSSNSSGSHSNNLSRAPIVSKEEL